ncbi:MAG: hypothetical protein LBQ52_04610 [Helicobacteraceae bacterium]|jgi:hypothetical protein|nr:hypothetical protein [Helicobacteraceae bacterium]
MKVESYEGYNARRYTRPWGAKLSIKEGKMAFDFAAGNFVGEWNVKSAGRGDLHIDAKDGDAIAWGCKDTRGASAASYAIVKNGEAVEMEKTEVYNYLLEQKNPPVKDGKQEAIAAINAGDYQKAIAILQSLIK